MPAAILVPAISAAIGTGATYAASRSASKASNRASETQARADADAMAFEREREAEARRQWDAEQAFQQQQFAAQEEERQYARRLAEEREARLAPYRATSAAALGRLGTMLGIAVPPMGGTGGPAAPMSGGAPMGAQGGALVAPRSPHADPRLAPPAIDPITLGDQLQLRSRRPVDWGMR